LQRESRARDAFFNEREEVRRQHKRLDAWLVHTNMLMKQAQQGEFLPSPLTEAMNSSIQGAQLLRYSTAEVVDTFFATRCAGTGAWGSNFGTLGIPVKRKVAQRIYKRAGWK
jgi:hypothetical protein